VYCSLFAGYFINPIHIGFILGKVHGLPEPIILAQNLPSPTNTITTDPIGSVLNSVEQIGNIDLAALTPSI
jgi:hypothetical protein